MAESRKSIPFDNFGTPAVSIPPRLAMTFHARPQNRLRYQRRRTCRKGYRLISNMGKGLPSLSRSLRLNTRNPIRS